MSRLIAIINAARHVAAERIERAAKGELPRLPQLLAAVALDATHAYLKLYGDDELPVQDMGTIRTQPAQHPDELTSYAPPPVMPSEHGPN